MRKTILLPVMLICFASLVSAGISTVIYNNTFETQVNLTLEGCAIENNQLKCDSQNERATFLYPFNVTKWGNNITLWYYNWTLAPAGATYYLGYIMLNNQTAEAANSPVKFEGASSSTSRIIDADSSTNKFTFAPDTNPHDYKLVYYMNNSQCMWRDGSFINCRQHKAGRLNGSWMNWQTDSGGTWETINGFAICNGTSCYIASNPIPPVLSKYNCTSCNPPEGDNESPYTTQDTTPTFAFETNEDAWCRIGDDDINYTTMSSSRDCTSGEGTQTHTCTLTVQDQLLINETDSVYISCKDAMNDESEKSSSGPLNMSITTEQVGVLGDLAIIAGINSSSIWPATVYSNQQVYLRDVNNNQLLATFDKVAVYGNQRWAFNYLATDDSFISGLFNITPVFYAVEYQGMIYQELNDSVKEVIDNTKS